LAQMPHALDPERGFRTRSRFTFHDFITLARPASVFRFFGDLVLSALKAHRNIERDGWVFLERLLEVNSSRVQSDVNARVLERLLWQHNLCKKPITRRWLCGHQDHAAIWHNPRADILTPMVSPHCKPMPLGYVREPFSDPNWLFEIKWDGFRSLVQVHEGECRLLISRNGNAHTRGAGAVDSVPPRNRNRIRTFTGATGS
jgi:hypothetical protein